jgi:predicted ABC-type ATPase
MLEKLDELTAKGESFAFETTLSGLGYVQRIRKWKEQGYRIKIFFVGLSDVELSIERVAQRVSLGGHNIPTDVLRRSHARWEDRKGLSQAQEKKGRIGLFPPMRPL